MVQVLPPPPLLGELRLHGLESKLGRRKFVRLRSLPGLHGLKLIVELPRGIQDGPGLVCSCSTLLLTALPQLGKAALLCLQACTEPPHLRLEALRAAALVLCTGLRCGQPCTLLGGLRSKAAGGSISPSLLRSDLGDSVFGQLEQLGQLLLADSPPCIVIPGELAVQLGGLLEQRVVPRLHDVQLLIGLQKLLAHLGDFSIALHHRRGTDRH
mmetsp:Transcript_86667/g.279951  ORF Transcript_86667/g.279951 Transcript_86667/m.279951 type:complete len:212 (-) Transcript_86667:99-734(-)